MDARPAAKASPLPMVLGIVGGLMLFIGAFLTWVTASFDVSKLAQALGVDPALMQGAVGSQSQSASGLHSQLHGTFALIAGILVVACAVVLFVRADLGKIMGALMIVFGVIGAGVALYDISRVNHLKNDVLGSAAGLLQGAGVDPGVLGDAIKVTPGIGIWICIAGGLVAAVGGIFALMAKSAAPAAMSSAGTGVPAAASGFESAPVTATPPAPEPPPMRAPDTPEVAEPPSSDMGTTAATEPPPADIGTTAPPEPPPAPETDEGAGTT